MANESIIIDSIRLVNLDGSITTPSRKFSSCLRVLENCLRRLSCLTTRDVVIKNNNTKDNKQSVLETQPGKAVSIIESDKNVEFAAPLGYQNPEKKKDSDPSTAASGFFPFKGEGHRLHGKKKRDIDDDPPAVKIPCLVGILDCDWKPRTITFMQQNEPQAVRKEEIKSIEFSPFSGKGHTLKDDQKEEKDKDDEKEDDKNK